MNKKIFTMLLEELPTLQAKGILDKDNSERLHNYCLDEMATMPKCNQMLHMLLGVFATLLIVGGIILIISFNWDMMSVGNHLLIGYLPFLLAILAGGYVLLKYPDNVGARESAALVVGGCGASALAVVSQCYQTLGTTTDFLMVVLIFWLFLILIFRSFALGMAYALCFAWVVSEINDNLPVIIIVNLLFLGILPFMIREIFIDANRWRSKITQVTFMLIATLWYVQMSDHTLHQTTMIPVGVMYILLGLLLSERCRWNLLTPIGVIMVMTNLCLVIVDRCRGVSEISPEFIVSNVLLLIGMAYIIWKKRCCETYLALLPLLLIVGQFIVADKKSYIVKSSVFFEFVAMGVFAAGGIILLWLGYRRRSFGMMNFGMLLLVVLVLTKFLSLSGDYAVAGIIFIAFGVVAFIINYLLQKTTRKAAGEK
ncbi:MAG: DUF2157 domain-containing protein [Victivallaceae bacterium]